MIYLKWQLGLSSPARKRVRRNLRLGGGVAIMCLGLAASGCSWITRVSVDSNGNEANSTSESPAISGDGRYVAFRSHASNLVPNDTSGYRDIFLHDQLTGTTSRVNVSSSGGQASGDSEDPSISADGRYITFSSYATNLAGGVPGFLDVFLRDTLTGTTSRVSVSSIASAGDDESASGKISADGRYIAFDSYASNLLANDSNDKQDVFVRDTLMGTTSLVSVDSSGNLGNGDSARPSISSDGRYIAFASRASNLIAGDTNGWTDVFLRDTVTETTSRISVHSSGAEGNHASITSTISGDGRYIAFDSLASNLVTGDSNGEPDVFLHDTDTGSTSRFSVDSNGGQSNGQSGQPEISADGRYIVFGSGATNLVPGNDTNNSGDVFVRDTVTGTTTRASVTLTGVGSNFDNRRPGISADGRYVVFQSSSSNLIPGDSSTSADIFVKANPQPQVHAVVPANLPQTAATPVVVTGTNFVGASMLLTLGEGVIATNVTIVSETQLTADFTVESGATVGNRNVIVGLPGTGHRSGKIDSWGMCGGCVTIVP